MALLLTLFGQQAEGRAFQSKAAQVVITNKTGKDCYFQPEGTPGYTAVTPDAQGRQIFNIDLQAPAYYQYMDGKQRFYSIYLTPGSQTEITESAAGVAIEGDHASINSFINANRFFGEHE